MIYVYLRDGQQCCGQRSKRVHPASQPPIAIIAKHARTFPRFQLTDGPSASNTHTHTHRAHAAAPNASANCVDTTVAAGRPELLQSRTRRDYRWRSYVRARKCVWHCFFGCCCWFVWWRLFVRSFVTSAWPRALCGVCRNTFNLACAAAASPRAEFHSIALTQSQPAVGQRRRHSGCWWLSPVLTWRLIATARV